MSYKTLIIIDNSSALTTLNRETMRETLKYIINNTEDEIAIAKTGENAEYIVEYEDSLNTRLKAVEDIEFTDSTAPVTDLLMKVIMDWKDDDLAMRDVLIISGSDITANADYTLEELFFEINKKDYPVYSIACSQEGNDACIKNLASVSRISGGECFDINETESEADVGKQIGDKYFKAVKNRREVLDAIHEVKEEQNIVDSDDEEAAEALEQSKYDDNANVSDKYGELIQDYAHDIEVSEYTDDSQNAGIIYENSGQTAPSVNMLMIPAIAVAATICVLTLITKIKRMKSENESSSFSKRIGAKGSSKRNEERDRPAFDMIRNESMTVALGRYDGFDIGGDDDDGGTRLLYQGVEGVDLSLEDRNNPTKYYRTCLRESVVIGRNEKLCDIAINYDDSVSGKHCEFYLRGSEVYCRDLDSSNGTMVNQQKVYQEIRVESGDVLRIGRLSFYVQISKPGSGGRNG